jgi:hypothetical protein
MLHRTEKHEEIITICTKASWTYLGVNKKRKFKFVHVWPFYSSESVLYRLHYCISEILMARWIPKSKTLFKNINDSKENIIR